MNILSMIFIYEMLFYLYYISLSLLITYIVLFYESIILCHAYLQHNFDILSFKVFTYTLSNSVGLFLDVMKVLIIIIYRKKFLNLIAYMQKNFWHLNYDENEEMIMANVKRICVCFVYVQTFSSLITISFYMIQPFLCNIINSYLKQLNNDTLLKDSL